MNKISSFIYFLILIFSCQGNSKESLERKDAKLLATVYEDNVEYELESLEGVNGIISVDMLSIYNQTDSLKIFNIDKTEFAELFDNKLRIKGVDYDLSETRASVLNSLISSWMFFPEYDLFMVECIGKVPGYFKVLINGETKLISSDSKLLSFETYEEHILNYYPIPTDENPLKLLPEGSSSIIEDYDDYSYHAVEIKGDWVKLECDSDCGNICPSPKVVGWIRWRNKEGRLIAKIAYSC